MSFLRRESLDSSIVEQAPEEGEDFQAIADDYQKLVVPGE